MRRRMGRRPRKLTLTLIVDGEFGSSNGRREVSRRPRPRELSFYGPAFVLCSPSLAVSRAPSILNEGARASERDEPVVCSS